VAILVTLITATYHCRPISHTATQPRTTVSEDIVYSMKNRLSAPLTAAGLGNDRAANVILLLHSVVSIMLAYTHDTRSRNRRHKSTPFLSGAAF